MRLGVQLRPGVLLPLRFLFSSAGFFGFGIHSAGEHTHDPAKLEVKSSPAINHPNSLTLELNSGQEDMSPSHLDVSIRGPETPFLGDLCLHTSLQHLIQILFSSLLL